MSCRARSVFEQGFRPEDVVDIIGVCPVDKKTKAKIMSDCESNPYHQPWH
ncbi:hypothetical protein [Streptomyces sp. NPDC052107]